MIADMVMAPGSRTADHRHLGWRMAAAQTTQIVSNKKRLQLLGAEAFFASGEAGGEDAPEMEIMIRK